MLAGLTHLEVGCVMPDVWQHLTVLTNLCGLDRTGHLAGVHGQSLYQEHQQLVDQWGEWVGTLRRNRCMCWSR